MGFRVLPIDATFTESVRKTLLSPQYGFPTHAELAMDQAPCRSCLNGFRIGEERRLLFTYNPFDGIDPYPLPGPVYIHEHACAAYDGREVFPAGLRSFSLMLEGYGRGRWLISRERPVDGDMEGSIGRIFENVAVDYIHIRSAKAGCYIARVERSL